MVHNKDKWIAALKKAVEDTKAKPSSGIACAIASVRVIRDGLVDDLGKGEATVDDVKEACNELIKSLIANRKELAGFASNASAAAKAAGFATELDELADLSE